MKIIYLANFRMPTERAHGVQTMKMCEAFAKAGLEVELVLPRRFTSIKANPFDYYAVTQNFRIKKLPVLDLIPLDFILGPFAFWIESLTFLLSAKFYLWFKKYDLFYTREDFSGFFFKNFVLEVHTLPARMRNASQLVVLTSYLKKKLVESGFGGENILVAPDGIDFNEFQVSVSKEEARRRLNLPLDKRIVMFIGLFDAWKGYDVLLEASRSFPPDAKLIMIGGRKAQIKELRSKYPDVIFTGYLPYKLLPQNQRAADVLVIPNSAKYEISKYHTSPLKLFAHMASGVPIVVSDLPSLREVLNEFNAFFVEPDNPRAFAEGIARVLSDKAFSQKISRRALEDVKKYTWENRARNILDFIQKNHVR